VTSTCIVASSDEFAQGSVRVSELLMLAITRRHKYIYILELLYRFFSTATIPFLPRALPLQAPPHLGLMRCRALLALCAAALALSLLPDAAQGE
jgi:hypothetical protein